MKEKGFTNGNIKFNTSRGMINGLTNGNGKKDGLINGNGSPAKKKKGGMMNSPKGRAGTWLVIGVVLLVVFGAFAISTNSLKKTDWNLIKKYVDVDTGTIDVSSVNITKFAFHVTGNTFEFYLKFAGNFGDTDEYQNLAYILIDNDSNPNTGYNAGYLGADYMVRLAGNNGTITAYFMKFNALHNNIWNWSSVEGVGVNEGNNKELTGVVNEKINPNAKIMVVAESKYTEDITPVVGIQKAALLVKETPSTDSNTLKVTLIAMYSAVNVTSIDLYTSEGVLLSGDNVKGNSIVNIGTVTPGSPKTITVNVDTSNVMNSAVKVSVDKVHANAPVTIWGSAFKKFVGTPKGIEIDGCFTDWNQIVGVKNFNHNYHSVANANIDLFRYASYSKGGNYFYADVLGNMLAGNIAPEMESVGNWSGGPVHQEPKSPFDSATITFTTVSGEKHTIQVFGVLGHVELVLFDGKPASKVSVGVGKNGEYGAIEIGIAGATYKIKEYRVTMTDWNGLTDVGVAHPSTGKSSGLAPDAPEFNVGYLAALMLIVPIVLRRKKN